MQTRTSTLCSVIAAIAFAPAPDARSQSSPRLSHAEMEANARRMTEVEAQEALKQPEGRELQKLLAGKWEGKTSTGKKLTLVFEDAEPPTMQITEADEPPPPAYPYAILTRAGEERAGRIGSFPKDMVVVIHRAAQDQVPVLDLEIVSLKPDAIQIVADGIESRGLKAALKRMP